MPISQAYLDFFLNHSRANPKRDGIQEVSALKLLPFESTEDSIGRGEKLRLEHLSAEVQCIHPHSMLRMCNFSAGNGRKLS